MPTTFVTAFLDLREDRTKDKSFDTCFNLANKLFLTGNLFYVFLSRSFEAQGTKLSEEYKNIKVHYIELEDLETYKEAESTTQLPSIRTNHHDTKAFMILMNSKIEFVQKAIQEDPFQTSHFAWIDFSIFHVFRNPEKSSKYLQMLGNARLKDSVLAFPGCWNKGQDISTIFDKVSWRFCGGFFIGDKQSLLNFYSLYRREFPLILEIYGVLPWEVNMWHFMELNYGFSPTWFLANHDDSIVRIPGSCLYIAASLTTIPPRIETDCRKSIESLVHQVDHIYVSISKEYKRFGTYDSLPSYMFEEPFQSKVTFVFGSDYGPAGKYIGCLEQIPENAFIFICDDDQEYHPTLIQRMTHKIQEYAVYQNHYSSICGKTSGGLIHGYVGLLIPKAFLSDAPLFPLPEASRFVDDQWMSFYCFTKNIPINSTDIEQYSDIFSVLDNFHEKWGTQSLSGLQNREDKIKELSSALNLTFDQEHKYIVKRLEQEPIQEQLQDQICPDS